MRTADGSARQFHDCRVEAIVASAGLALDGALLQITKAPTCPFYVVVDQEHRLPHEPLERRNVVLLYDRPAADDGEARLGRLIHDDSPLLRVPRVSGTKYFFLLTSGQMLPAVVKLASHHGRKASISRMRALRAHRNRISAR